MIWHVAFSVPNLEEGIEKFSESLLLREWTPIKHFVGDATYPDGTPYKIDTRLAFATDGPVAFELFEAIPGTPNAPMDGTVFHHMGYWAGAPTIAEEEARLAECEWFRTGGDVTADSRAAFFASKLGIWLEACNVNVERKGLDKYYPAR
ncbi:VOC family protein [Streptomyces sp. NPDC050625]|uniref:VOC family protein n=1 Tax=Streptomyces sp. NPDC050625 TaxID=3154629 RepID=UPI00342292C1